MRPKGDAPRHLARPARVEPPKRIIPNIVTSVKKTLTIGDQIKRLKEQYEQSEGSFCVLDLSKIETNSSRF